jgi:hypothetical protein
MDNNQNNNPFPGGIVPPTKELGTGEGESPLAIPDIKPENIAARTMNSDMASIQTQGGGQPVAYTPTTQPKPEVFVPPQAETAPINPTTIGMDAPAAMPADASAPSGNKKPIIMGLASFVIVIALGAIGWFVIYPNFSAEEVIPEEIPEASLPAQEENLPPAMPSEESSVLPLENSTSSATTSEEMTETETPETLIHSSFLKIAADAVTELNFEPATLENYKTAFPGGTAEVALFKEIVFKNQTGAYSSGEILALIAPQSLGSDKTLFAADFTAFSYTDKNGVWPGLVLKIAEGKKEAAATAVKSLETTEESANFFGGTTPGTATTWKDGKIGTYAGRYLTFATTGASLNYAVAGDYVVISTSYAGAQEVAKRLGL